MDDGFHFFFFLLKYHMSHTTTTFEQVLNGAATLHTLQNVFKKDQPHTRAQFIKTFTALFNCEFQQLLNDPNQQEKLQAYLKRLHLTTVNEFVSLFPCILGRLYDEFYQTSSPDQLAIVGMKPINSFVGYSAASGVGGKLIKISDQIKIAHLYRDQSSYLQTKASIASGLPPVNYTSTIGGIGISPQIGIYPQIGISPQIGIYPQIDSNPFNTIVVKYHPATNRCQSSDQQELKPPPSSFPGPGHTPMAPGYQRSQGKGVDIKHNSYNRYLNRLKGNAILPFNINQADTAPNPKYGNKIINVDRFYQRFTQKIRVNNQIINCGCLGKSDPLFSTIK